MIVQDTCIYPKYSDTLNPCPAKPEAFANSVDPDQLASEEVN